MKKCLVKGINLSQDDLGSVILTSQMGHLISSNSTKCCLKLYHEYLILSRSGYNLEQLPNFCLRTSLDQFSFSHLNILIPC